jgi:hypothetical protein
MAKRIQVFKCYVLTLLFILPPPYKLLVQAHFFQIIKTWILASSSGINCAWHLQTEGRELGCEIWICPLVFCALKCKWWWYLLCKHVVRMRNCNWTQWFCILVNAKPKQAWLRNKSGERFITYSRFPKQCSSWTKEAWEFYSGSLYMLI